MLQMTNSLQSSNNPGSKGHISKQMDHMNLPPQHMQFQVHDFFILSDFQILDFVLEHESSSSYVRPTRFNASTF